MMIKEKEERGMNNCMMHETTNSTVMSETHCHVIQQHALAMNCHYF